MDNHPPEEAYGRVTNPERFQPVVDAALLLIDDLTVRYQVVRSSGISSVDFPTLEGAPLDTVRLTPDQGAPMTWAITPFPGIFLAYGRWGQENFPHCGCDACGEKPDYLIERLHETVGAVVAGGYTEVLTKKTRMSRIEFATGWNGSETPLAHGEWRQYGDLGERRWPSWPRVH